MGAWGSGLYSNDTAREVKDAIREIVRLPGDGAFLLDTLLQAFPPGEESDDDYSATWLVLADQFHRYAIDCPALFQKARHIIANGIDDRLMAALGMTPGDRDARKQALTRLIVDWSKAPQKPAGRKVLKAPLKNPLGPGEVWIYPTQGGNSANVLDPLSSIRKTFKPDGWSAFVVARNEFRYGFYPASFLIRLHVEQTTPPSLAACREARVGGRILRVYGEAEPSATCGWAPMSGWVIQKLGAKKIGALAVDWEMVRAKLPVTAFKSSARLRPVHNLLFMKTPGVTLGGKTLPPEILDESVPVAVKVRDVLA
jgi:hypothetical protein